MGHPTGVQEAVNRSLVLETPQIGSVDITPILPKIHVGSWVEMVNGRASMGSCTIKIRMGIEHQRELEPQNSGPVTLLLNVTAGCEPFLSSTGIGLRGAVNAFNVCHSDI